MLYIIPLAIGQTIGYEIKVIVNLMYRKQSAK